jgi:hypothetical protein
MSNFTLHLGFNWNSPEIGSFWGTSAINAALNNRFLQYALADERGAPAWFQFAAGDGLAVELWDLSSPTTTPAGEVVLALAMGFAPLEAGPQQAYDPMTLVDPQGAAVPATLAVDGRREPYLDFSAISSAAGKSGPWGACRGHYVAGAIALRSAADYKLSFSLRAALSGSGLTPRLFVSDPEVIVGSRGG